MLYGEDAEIKALETQNKVLSAFYENEKINPAIVTLGVKQEIAKCA
jgi:hypothetical protein